MHSLALFSCLGSPLRTFPFFQIAYRTASNKFPGKLAELFLVLSDSHVLLDDGPGAAAGFSGRGQKHRLDDDQMSVHSVEPKRPDVNTSAEKDKSKSKKFSKNKPKGKN